MLAHLNICLLHRVTCGKAQTLCTVIPSLSRWYLHERRRLCKQFHAVFMCLWWWLVLISWQDSYSSHQLKIQAVRRERMINVELDGLKWSIGKYPRWHIVEAATVAAYCQSWDARLFVKLDDTNRGGKWVKSMRGNLCLRRNIKAATLRNVKTKAARECIETRRFF